VRRAEHHPIDEHPRPHSARDIGWQFGIMWTSFFLPAALKAAAQSGMPRALDLVFVRLIKAA
jgi:hypothetical protein